MWKRTMRLREKGLNAERVTDTNANSGLNNTVAMKLINED